MPRRRNVNQIYDPVLSVQVQGTEVDELVYLLVANRPHNYGKHSSRIVYIGTTVNGLWRISLSASERIYDGCDELRGFKRLDAYVIWYKVRRGRNTYRGFKIYKLLERAALIVFREMHGKVPILNGNGNGLKEDLEFEVFSKQRIETIIRRYA